MQLLILGCGAASFPQSPVSLSNRSLGWAKDHTNQSSETHLQDNGGSQMWRHTPVIPAPRKQRQYSKFESLRLAGATWRTEKVVVCVRKELSTMEVVAWVRVNILASRSTRDCHFRQDQTGKMRPVRCENGGTEVPASLHTQQRKCHQFSASWKCNQWARCWLCLN